MGKRKKAAKKPTGPRKSEPLATTFACLFCNHEKSVTVKLDRKAGVGQLSCKVCGQSFQCQVNYLSAAVDVYSEWVDACDSVAKKNTDDIRARNAPQLRTATGGFTSSGTRDVEQDVAEDDGDDQGVGGYEGEGIVADDEY